MKTANLVREVILPAVLLGAAFYSSTGKAAGRDTGHSPYNLQRIQLSHCLRSKSTDCSDTQQKQQAYDYAALQVYINQGMWPEMIQASAEQQSESVQSFKSPRNATELQGMDSLHYAYLQSAQDSKAEQISQAVMGSSFAAETSADLAYYLAIIPARLALEQRDWQQAAGLKLQTQHTELVQAFPQYESILVFARALGAARSGDVTSAKAEMRRLNQLYQTVKREGNRHEREQLAMQVLAAQAWIQQAQGHQQAAVDLLQKASSTELGQGGQLSSRNSIVPMSELLGDLYLEQGQLAAAKDAYVQTLRISRNRYNSLYGAAFAAERLGDSADAENYYVQLLSQARGTSSGRPSLQHARDYVSSHDVDSLSFSVSKS